MGMQTGGSSPLILPHTGSFDHGTHMCVCVCVRVLTPSPKYVFPITQRVTCHINHGRDVRKKMTAMRCFHGFPCKLAPEQGFLVTFGAAAPKVLDTTQNASYLHFLEKLNIFPVVIDCLFKPTGEKKKKLDHGWPESITSQARSAQRCRMRSFSLHEAFVKQARDSTRQGALRKLVGASWSVQVALRKLLRASCSGKLVPASGSLQVALCKLRSLQVALCKLLCASCSVQVALRKLLCASCSRQGALRKLVGASWSAQVALRKLL